VKLLVKTGKLSVKTGKPARLARVVRLERAGMGGNGREIAGNWVKLSEIG
jgi:hypothetical protein